MRPTLDAASGIFQQLHQSIKAVRLHPQHGINDHSQFIPIGEPSPITFPFVIGQRFSLRIMNDRKLMLFTDRIAELSKVLAAAFYIPVFMPAVQRCCADDNVIVHMLLVDVCRNDVGILIIGYPGRQLFPDRVCFLRSDLSGFESLTDVIDQHFIMRFPPGCCLGIPVGTA